ncbi:penicillin acylase family protein [Janthinobacterium sp. GB4P2]|uniref:penicillin acylase family protein n=1 Tax=Janthinobacterium sp. GB4P2 TaxID=3424189 RepID=UPI003F205BB4
MPSTTKNLLKKFLLLSAVAYFADAIWKTLVRKIPYLAFFVICFSPWHSALSKTGASVEIRRTSDGIPHVRASDWFGLGRGVGYVQSEDAICTLAEAFLTYKGQRSRYFGLSARPSEPSTFGQPKNVDLDIFFRYLLSDSALQKFKSAQPGALLALAEGFADGYNEYLRKVQWNTTTKNATACISQPWVQSITSEDILRRMMAVGIAAGYEKFIPEIVNAVPPAPIVMNKMSNRIDRRIGTQVGESTSLGSNMIAMGQAATGGSSAVLLGNPHWFWSGPDRFYQIHMTIPGTINVAGATFLGIPLVMIGFNESIAWSHTVSSARRYGMFELSLVPGKPDWYRYEGTERQMDSTPIVLDGKDADGRDTHVARTLYRSHLGLVVDLREQSDELAWTGERALVIKDANEENFRIFSTYLRLNQARSLNEFAAIQREEVGMPWVHTAAIGANDGRLWYADIGPVPNVPDELRERCTSPLGKLIAHVDPMVPVLDGSRLDCTWRVDARARQPGLMPWQEQPSEWRSDYVANMNGSYWPISSTSTLRGYPKTMGGEGAALSMRTRLGHQLANELAAVRPLAPAVLSYRLQDKALDSRAYSAQQYKPAVLSSICKLSSVLVARDTLSNEEFSPPRQVSILDACSVLRTWNGTGNVHDDGAILWDAFWNRVRELPDDVRYLTAFSIDDPLNTPSTLNVEDSRVISALGEAVISLQKEKIDLHTSLGEHLYAGTGSAPIPLYGGCETSGYFTIMCDDKGEYKLESKQFIGNSYMQVVRFTDDGPIAHTLLAHGQREFGYSGKHIDPGVKRYAQKKWLMFPFNEVEIRRDPALSRMILKPVSRSQSKL